MRTEFVYSFMALGAIPVVANAADVQSINANVLASANGSEVEYAVGKLVPGHYAFTAKLTTKVYDVSVEIGGVSKVAVANTTTPYEVNLEFDLTAETDVKLKLKSSDPGEPGAGFTVADAKIILDFNFANIKSTLANNADALAAIIGNYNYAAKQEDVDAANALKTKAQGIAESYDDYKKYKLFTDKSTIQDEIDQLAAKAEAAEAAYQNEQAYNRVNSAITTIKAKYNTAVAEFEETLVGTAAYLLDAAKADLNENINKKITEATAASYASYTGKTAVADEDANKALVPTETDLNNIVNNWKGQAQTNKNAYAALHNRVVALQNSLNAVQPVAAIASQFDTEKNAAQAAINTVNTKVENAKNSAAQLNLDINADEATAQDKINTLAGKVNTANAEYNANQAALAKIAILQTNLNNAKAAVNQLKSTDGQYEAKNYYDAYVADIQNDINDRTAAAKKAYETDHNAVSYNVNDAPVQAKIDAYAGTTEPAVDGMPKQAVAKYNALQTAITGYQAALDAARNQMKDLAVYNDAAYDYQTKLDLIQKRINDINKLITAAKKKVGADHWNAMLAIDENAEVENKTISEAIADLVSTYQGDQNEYDANLLATGITELEEKIETFKGKTTDDAVYGDDFAAFAGVEAGIEDAFNAVKAAKAAVNPNSDTVDRTNLVGTEMDDWSVAAGNKSNKAKLVNNQVEHYENSGSPVGNMLWQEVEVENGIYDVEVLATSHRANITTPLEADANDVAYVFAKSGNSNVQKFITARKNNGFAAVEPETYALNGVKVENGKLTIGLAIAKAGLTNWHTIQIKSLKITTASLIQKWGAEITELNGQQDTLESVANEVAAKVASNTSTKSTLGTNITNLQTAMGTFATTYKIGQDDSTLGNRGKTGGSVTTEVTAINDALSTLAGQNDAVDVTAVTNVDKTAAVGTTANDWKVGEVPHDGNANRKPGDNNPELIKTCIEQWSTSANVNKTGILITQTVSNLPNGVYDLKVYAFASNVANGKVQVTANGKAQDVPLTGNAEEVTINGAVVLDGKLTINLVKLNPGTSWHGIQIKSLNYHENTSAILPTYNETYLALANRKNTLDTQAPTIKGEVEANATTYAAANTALINLQATELNTLKSLTNVTDANAVSTDDVAKKTDPANWKVFETGLASDKSYTAKKAAIDADTLALRAAIDAAKAEEMMVAKWKNNSITVVTGKTTKTYSITGITNAINALKTEAEAENANYLAYKELQDNNMSKLLPNNIFTKTVNNALVAMTDAEIETLIGTGAKAYYLGLKTQYTNDKSGILTRMKADLNARKAVNTKAAFVTEITALIAKVNAVQGDAAANYTKYNEQKTAYTETQTLWNSTYTEIAATDHSSKVQDWLNQLDAIQVDLTAATEAVEASYPLGKSVAKVQDFAAIKARINDVKARQAESYDEFVAADNAAAHASFMTAIAAANTAYQNAVSDRATYSTTNADIEDAVTTAAATLDQALYSCPTDLATLIAAENAVYEATVSPNKFDAETYYQQAGQIEQNITNYLAAFKTAVRTAIDGVWAPKENIYNAKVTAAETAITAYNDDAKKDAFKDIKDLIAKGKNGVNSMTLSEVETAIAGLENIDNMLAADKDVAADKDLTKRIKAADDKYADVKAYIDGVANDIQAKADQLTVLNNSYKTNVTNYAKKKDKNFANRNGIVNRLNNFVNAADNCKTTVENAVTNDNNNTAAYNEMTTAIAQVETKLTEAKAAASPYKYATSFAGNEIDLNYIKADATSYKNASSAVANKADVISDIAALSNDIENNLTTAFGTEKAGLATDITELKNQYNAYVAANSIDATATAFKTAIDDLNTRLVSIAIVDADNPADGIQYDEILAATNLLVELQNDIADQETALLAANASTANADVLANFNTKLGELEAAASLEGNDSWVGEQSVNGKKISESVAEIQGQIADVKAAIAAEENISFYKNQYQAQIDAIETALTPVTDAIAEKQAQFDANATAYAALSAKIDELQGKVNAAKAKVSAYQYVGPGKYFDYTNYLERDWDDDGVIDGGVQYSINWYVNDIKTRKEAVLLNDTYDLTSLVDYVNGQVQDYLDESAYHELWYQKRNLDELLAYAIDNKYQSHKYSSALWNRLIAEKAGISTEIRELVKAFESSYQQFEGSFDVFTNQWIWVSELGSDYYFTLDDNDDRIAKARTSDADYAAQMQTVAAIKDQIADLSDAVDNLDLLGDANVDGRVNVLDYQKVLNMILDPTLQPADDTDLFVNIDINQSDVIEVGDLTAIVNYILNQKWQEGYAAARGEKMVGESLAINTSSLQQGRKRIAVSLANVSDYTAFQMDLVLPDGMKMVGAELSDRAGESHKLYSRKQMDGSIRMVASSVTGETFSGNEGAVLYIDVEGAGTPELLNILFSDTNAVTRSFAIGNDATGIDTVGTFESLKQKVYDLGGRVKNGMKKGFNIIRRADGTTQKVVK